LRLTVVKPPKVKKPKPSLVRALWKAFGLRYALAALPLAMNNALQFAPPMLLRLLIQCTCLCGRWFFSVGRLFYRRVCCVAAAVVNDSSDDRDWYGYVLAVLMAVAMVLATLCENTYFDRAWGVRCGCTGSV
jgi:hypothetical protein